MPGVERLAVEARASTLAVAMGGVRHSSGRQTLQAIEAGLTDGRVVAYLGPGALTPAEPDRHDRSLGALHDYLASLRALPLIVHDRYDELAQRAFAVRGSWSDRGAVQGASRGSHFEWRHPQGDGETPIPEPLRSLGEGRHFLFLGCRFARESGRMFVRRMLQHACAPHWAVLDEPPTAGEASFMAEQNIEGIDLKLSDFVAALTELRQEEQAQLLLASW